MFTNRVYTDSVVANAEEGNVVVRNNLFELTDKF